MQFPTMASRKAKKKKTPTKKAHYCGFKQELIYYRKAIESYTPEKKLNK